MAVKKVQKTRSRKGKFQPAGGNWIYKVTRTAIYLRDGFTCLYCGKDLHGADPKTITLDHLKTRSELGANVAKEVVDSPMNLITACKSCNCSRQDKPWRKYATGGAIERIIRQRRKSLTRFKAMASALHKGKASNPICERRTR